MVIKAMANGTADCLIWEILEFQNCSYRVKADTKVFCRHPDSVTGLCDRKSCPLANSQYTTARLIKGKIQLRNKTPERAHMPEKLWENLELPEDVEVGNKIIDEEMLYGDEWQIEMVKKRYVRLVEVLQRMRELRKAPKVKEIPIKKKIERRNKAREDRALSVAHVEYSVKQELLRRLREGEYGEIYNLQEEEFKEALDEYEDAPMEFVAESDFEDQEVEFLQEDSETELAHA